MSIDPALLSQPIRVPNHFEMAEVITNMNEVADKVSAIMDYIKNKCFEVTPFNGPLGLFEFYTNELTHIRTLDALEAQYFQASDMLEQLRANIINTTNSEDIDPDVKVLKINQINEQIAKITEEKNVNITYLRLNRTADLIKSGFQNPVEIGVQVFLEPVVDGILPKDECSKRTKLMLKNKSKMVDALRDVLKIENSGGQKGVYQLAVRAHQHIREVFNLQDPTIHENTVTIPPLQRGVRIIGDHIRSIKTTDE